MLIVDLSNWPRGKCGHTSHTQCRVETEVSCLRLARTRIQCELCVVLAILIKFLLSGLCN